MTPFGYMGLLLCMAVALLVGVLAGLYCMACTIEEIKQNVEKLCNNPPKE
jgi:uncharacterized protein YneF (UPF0154 family)